MPWSALVCSETPPATAIVVRIALPEDPGPPHDARSLDATWLDATWLDDAERDRLGGFVRALDARRYARAHRGLRAVVGRFAGIAPQAVAWRTGPHGKPALANDAAHGLEFNLSHSGSWALAAVARAPVGIDVERLRPIDRLDRLAERWCTAAERARLAALDGAEREAHFLACWTAKEALLKAIGCGLAGDAQSIETPPPTEPGRFVPIAAPAALSSAPWQVAWFAPDSRHVAALACPPTIERVLLADWHGDG